LGNCQDLNISNLALNCRFSQCYKTRILTAKLLPYYSTYLLLNLRFKIEQQQDLLQKITLFFSETGDATGFRQQMNTTSFETFELEITVNYPLHTWTENGTFMRNLTSWSVPFRLVLLAEHEDHCWAMKTVYRCLVARQLYASSGFDSLQQTVDASKFLTLVGQFTQQPSCTILLWQIEIFKIRIACSCKMFMVLFNFY